MNSYVIQYVADSGSRIVDESNLKAALLVPGAFATPCIASGGALPVGGDADAPQGKLAAAKRTLGVP